MIKYTIEKEFRHHVVEWSATFLSVLGSIVNANKLISGFYIWSVANILWITFAIKHKHWGLLVMNVIFFGINIYGVFSWMAQNDCSC
ncbi:nicotinamide mononucleotide transporter [Candidatus Pacearchaeota archaeon]|nr:nicotinamide mononucleotide transporter [Candidatus Pacearchaeota archaeon]